MAKKRPTPINNKTKNLKKSPDKIESTPALKRVGKWFGLPAVFYFILFSIYSWPWIEHFNTRFFSDSGDGFQNVWNMWWVNKSVTGLHQLPWHTQLLHYPYGTTLLGQTLNPFNGFVGIGLQHGLSLSLVQSYNVMVVFSFVFGGVTAFWLCHFFTKRYLPSLIGGFIFTFSSYHFAHALGHLQLVSLEWIPLFILLWWKLLTTPRYRYAIGASVVLALTLLCDYYYFMYCVVTGGLIILYLWRTKQIEFSSLKRHYRPFLVFIVLSLVIVAPLPLALLHSNAQDPLQGSHDSRIFSADAGNIVLDGGFWRFGKLTSWYWGRTQAYVSESSIYLSFAVIAAVLVAIWKRKKLDRAVNFWLGLGIIFGIFSLGPRVLLGGDSIEHAPLPYAILERIFPDLKLSGMPVRMIVMTTLAGAVITSIVLTKVSLGQRKGQLLLVAFCLVLGIELWPSTLPVTVASAYPKYVTALAQLPPGGVLDNGAVSSSWQLYDQTITDKPIALGYISRTPTSVANKDTQFINTVTPTGYAKLCSEFKIRYVTTPVARPLPAGYKLVYRDSSTLIYDIKNAPQC